MARFVGKGSMKQVPLIAMWNEKQVTHNNEGEMTGAYLDIQVDQSNLTDLDVLQGKAQANPSLDTHTTRDGRVSHGVWYSMDQINTMASVGGPADAGVTKNGNRRMAMVFSADVMPKGDNGRKHMVVLLPKTSDSEADKAYNEKHPIAPSPNGMTKDDYAQYLENGVEYARPGAPYPGAVAAQSQVTQFRQHVASDAFLKDNLAELGDRVSDVSLVNPGGSDVRMLTAMVEEDVNRMLKRDGRLYPIDYSIMLDDERLTLECLDHDGFMVVSADGGVSIEEFDHRHFEDHGPQLANRLQYALRDRARNGTEIVWYDEKSTQEHMEAESPESLPAERHKFWDNAMKAFQDKVKSDMGLAKVTQQKTMAEPVLDAKNASKGYQKSQPLIAVWTDEDVRYDANGKSKGAMVDVQVDQSMLTGDDIKAGKGFSSPSVHYAYSQNPEQKPNKLFYTQGQLDMMQAVGKTATAGKAHGCSFTANVYTRTGEGNKDTSFVCLPKDESRAKDDKELADIRWYNDLNPLQGSIHETFTSKDLRNQFAVTTAVRDMTKDKDAELQSAFTEEHAAEAERAAEEEMDSEDLFA